ncbi:MAG: DNA recombination protein RmuC, partial [Sphingomonadales bacterium]|nr:DNA recombination protein RmuC [Sphingomonadales bacterium]
VLVTGRRFKELSVETGSREIEAIEPVEALARLPEPAAGEGAALPDNDVAEPAGPAEAAE